MLKYIFASLLLFSINGFAQSKSWEKDHENFFRFGAKGGLNINKRTGESYKNGFRYNFQAGLLLM